MLQRFEFGQIPSNFNFQRSRYNPFLNTVTEGEKKATQVHTK